MPRSERIGGMVLCDRGETHENYYSLLPRVDRDAFVEAYQPYWCGTKEESNTSNFNDGNGARRSRDPGWCGSLSLWVQRFAIITFRACRFVCINSVRQFPLCGVPSSQRRVRERESSLPLALALRGAVRSGRTRSPVEAHHACNPPPALILVLERTSGLILSRKDPLSGNR